ncbi:MAG: hypothetical protein PHC61_16285, partial [Chitinivibrionales bacterium]|nr:hypothetical protein [Chitinivibrionales bacterium]
MPKKSTSKIGAASFWTIYIPLLAITTIAGFVCGALVVDHWIVPRTGNVGREAMTVPALVNLQWEEARRRCAEAGLRMQVGER